MPQDVAVLLTVSGTDGIGLAAGMAAIRAARPDVQIVIVADEDNVEDPVTGPTRPRDIPVIGVRNLREGADAFEWNAVARSVSAPVIAAIPLTAVKSSADVLRALAAAAAAPAGSDHEPTLVPHPGTPRWVIASYVRDVLRGPAEDPARIAHAGELAMAAARLITEAVDPLGNQLRVTVRVSMPHGLQQQPPWLLRVMVHSPGGASACSPPTALRPRTDWAGRGQWEQLVAEVPLDQLPTGDYELAVGLVGEANVAPRPLRASIGAVTPGRTRKTTWTVHGRQGSTRYLPFTTGPARVTRLAVQQEARGRRAALAWSLRRLRQDLRHVARGKGGRRLRLLLLLRLLTRPLFRRQIWIVGERRDAAQDNGLHFFRFLRLNHPQRRVYYVIERESPEYGKIRRLGNVVAHSSWRHQLLMLHADVLANAFSIPYLIPTSWDRSAYNYHLAWRIGALRVFLQHGVHISPAALQRLTTGYDVVVTSTARETEALREVSGYDEQLVESGMARYDALTPGPGSRTVLFMTTWRRYLPSRVFAGQGRRTDTFEGSAYQRFTSGLLHSIRLHEILERHDHRLVFLPHHNLAEQFHQVRPASDRVEVLEPTGNDLQRLLRSCDVFVTDHSSVHFDAAYLGKPVIYARFDREEYESRHAAPSWFDFERDGYGPVTETLDETLDELERVLSTGCLQEQVYRERMHRLFTYHDQHNAQRLSEAIVARLARLRAELR